MAKPATFSSPRRILGRAASPPTYAWYEQIPYEDEYSSSSESESDEENYDDGHDYDQKGASQASQNNPEDSANHSAEAASEAVAHDDLDMDMDMDDSVSPPPADTKGKQRAVDPLPVSRQRQRHHLKRERIRAAQVLRPILTIHKSDGFVWNQDLFVPPYMKDRYVASTSPPNAPGFISSSVSSTNSALTEYENIVDIVEIRVREGDLDSIIP